MKRLVLTIVMIIGAFFSSFAQKQPTAEELAKKNVDELEKRLNLTVTQKNVVYNFAFTLAKEQLALYKRQQATGYNDEDMTRYYRLQNEINKSIKAVLKPEQAVEYDKVNEERLSGIDPTKKKKKLKKGEEEEKVVGIEGLKTGNN
jgi:protein CpxP